MGFMLIGDERGSGIRFYIKFEDLRAHVPLRFDVFGSKDRLLHCQTTEGFMMKMHVALAVALAALGSHGALAASEGGDTWSEVQPEPGVRSTRPLAVPAPAPASGVQRDYLYEAPARSEGGDTWSELQPQPYGRSSQSPAFATIAPLSRLQHEDPSVYGSPAQGDLADRVVQLGPNLHSINVAYGETITFVVNGVDGSKRSFAWRFDVSPALSHVDLRNVAPADFPAENVRVFVAPDSRYRGG